jgi:hypothetical protein
MAAGEAFNKIIILDDDAPDTGDHFDVGAVLKKSIESIIGDARLSKADKAAMLDKTTAQFVDYLGVRVTTQTNKGRQTEKDTRMDITAFDTVMDVIKSHHNGVVTFAKQELASDGPPMLSEREATALVTEHFRIYNRGQPDQAFAKGIANSPDGPLLMQWINSCKVGGWNAAAVKREGWVDPRPTSSPRFDTKPRQAGGNEAFHINEAKDAMAIYDEIVAEIRAAHPTLTATQVYSRAYVDRRHAEALARERGENRPGDANVRERVSGAEVPSSSSPGRLGHSPRRSSPGRP